MANLYLIRHGQTFLNKYHRIQGWADAQLTENGIKDAKKAGKRLSKINFDRAYSSDTTRARATAKIILSNNQAKVDQPVEMMGLREENFGYFEGNDIEQVWNMIGGPLGYTNYSDMIKAFSIEKVRDMIASADPYGDAENDVEFWNRVKPALDEITNNSQENENILIVAHGTMIRSVVSKFSEIDISDPIHNGSITKINFKNNQYKVEYYNKIDNNV
ncbi:histidine phosphatase family protein [Lactobacillus sp. S2-2]|uniref:histidine phosphatase family protein n=1 Tax=Lactobacillus sp. S2-2 TaxID=2692917 RepID=UPI001F15FE62|nr:histidine phosphatase family protein [Lactobacillus sp. S2-2]MCF6514734.1 histidine phosphatase family protein [Lactobacillus sp. S2-2]